MKDVAKTRADTKPNRTRRRGIAAVMLSGVVLSGCMSSLDLFSPEGHVDTSMRTGAVQNGNTERLTDEITVRNAVSSTDLARADKGPVPWANSASGSAGVISSITENRDAAGRTCRDFVTTKHSYQGIASFTGRTCMGNTGEWLLLSFDRQG